MTPRSRPGDFELTATDLSETSIGAAKKGIYAEDAMRNAPPQFREKYFVPISDKFQIQPEGIARGSLSRLNIFAHTKTLLMLGMNVIPAVAACSKRDRNGLDSE